MPSNYEVAAMLREIADLLEVKGEMPFKINAYREAGRQLEVHPEDVAALATQGRLRQVPGVGAAIAQKVDEYVSSGRLGFLERLQHEVPPTLVELLRVPGLGPKKIRMLHDQLGVASIADLEAALRAEKVRDLPGMGAKTEERLLAEVVRWEARNRRLPIGVARPAAEEVARLIEAGCPDAVGVQPAGSLRRWVDTIGDVDLIAASDRPDAVLDCFVGLPIVKEVLGRGGTKASVLTYQNLQMDLRVVPAEAYGAALLYFTGSKAHNVKLRTLCQRRGLTLNEYGLVEEATGRVAANRTEEDIYRALGMAWVPPELREDLGEIELAQQDALPRLVEAASIRGELHCHSTWSDGHLSIAEMAQAAAARGWEYLAITDHSQSLAMTGLSAEQVGEQWTEIDRVNAGGGPLRVLKGIELEIRPDGSLDYPDELLARFDLVIASVHSGFRQDRATLTERMVRAVRNRHVDVIGHPSGRIIGRREPYDVDLDTLLRAAAESGTAVEINANPERLDLDAPHARTARELGVPVPINTDAHHPDNFELLRYGVATGRRAWLRPEDVLNTRPLAELLAWLNRG
ncbi:MAG TPA: DNA polymerase/3'-5' exonuclease PolX [Chloroflexota bacterium]